MKRILPALALLLFLLMPSASTAQMRPGMGGGPGSSLRDDSDSRPDPGVTWDEGEQLEASPLDEFDTAWAGQRSAMVGPIIREIRFVGLLRTDRDTVMRQLGSAVLSELKPEQVSRDIKTLYRMRAFKNIEVRVIPEDDGVVLVFKVEEYPAVALVKTEGNKKIDNDKLREKISVKESTILDMVKVENSVKAIRDHYVEEGYFLAEVTFRLDPKPDNVVDVIFVVREYAKVKVRSIEFLGNNNLTDEELKKFMQTQEGNLLSILSTKGIFAQEMLDMDMRRLEFYYNTKGYAEVRFELPIVMLSRDRKHIAITITVHEGPKYNVGKVDVGGDMLFPKEELTSKLLLKEGDVFNAENIQKDIIWLMTKYKDEGYAFCNVGNTTSLDKSVEPPLINFTYIVQMGSRARIARIDITGNEGTRDWTIRRELRMYEGDLFNETAMKKSEARIRRLGFFEEVEITPRQGDAADLVILTVKVKERQTGAFSIGAGFSSVENFLFQAQISKQNFLGRGQSLRLEASLSSIRKYFVFSFDDPYFFDTDWTFGFSAYNRDYVNYTFDENSTGLNLTIGRRFADYFSIAATYRLEMVDVKAGGQENFFDVPVANMNLNGLTSSLTVTLAFDNRDDRMFPTKGNVTTLSMEWAGSEIGSSFDYIRFRASTKQYFPLFLGAVGKVSLRYGYIFNPKGGPVPIFQRFQAGGIFSIRGYEQASLGPSIPVGASRDPASSLSYFTIGGDKELIFNFEVEFPIIKTMGIKGVVFFDAGNAFDDTEWPNPLNFQFAAGLGIRWWSPIGPLRFEWGFPINPREGDPPYVFEFNIGAF